MSLEIFDILSTDSFPKMLALLLFLLPLCALCAVDTWVSPLPYQKGLLNTKFEVWQPGEVKELRWQTTLPQYNVVLNHLTGYAVIYRQSQTPTYLPYFLQS